MGVMSCCFPDKPQQGVGGMDSYPCRELGAPDASLLSLEGGTSLWRKGVSVSEHVAFISEQHKCLWPGGGGAGT